MALPTISGTAPDVISAQGLTGCVIDECGKKIVGRGRCRRHYSQWWRATRNTARPPALHLKGKRPEQRFREKVNERGPDECWPWLPPGDKFGHGQFFVSPERGTVPAHVFALELATGDSCPPGKEGCHHCDNPPCCNPAHVYYGTRQQNVDDMHRRGRACVGSAAPGARLTEADVVEIRERFARGELLKTLAERFDIGDGHVSQIVNGLKWKTAGGPITTRKRLGASEWRTN